MKNHWIKLLCLSAFLTSSLSIMSLNADASWWKREAEKKAACSASACNDIGYNKCASFYDSLADAVSHNPNCFASASTNCASDCTSDANCAVINSSACSGN